MDTELVLDGDTTQIVGRAERPVVIHQKLRNDEQADALGAGG